jgi:hypothetical protein
MWIGPLNSGSATPCPAGTYGATAGLSFESDCSTCLAGNKCTCFALRPCLLLSIHGMKLLVWLIDPCFCALLSISGDGSGSMSQCGAGSYAPAGAGGCTGCPTYAYCPAGSGGPTPCAAGTYGASANLGAQSQCTTCVAGNYCTLSPPTPHASACHAKNLGERTEMSDVLSCNCLAASPVHLCACSFCSAAPFLSFFLSFFPRCFNFLLPTVLLLCRSRQRLHGPVRSRLLRSGWLGQLRRLPSVCLLSSWKRIAHSMRGGNLWS